MDWLHKLFKKFKNRRKNRVKITFPHVTTDHSVFVVFKRDRRGREY